jgi:hypothetical protein
VYNYTFYATGIVQVNGAFLQPALNIFAGFLTDRTLVGMFLDGLHIGEHIVPYPIAYIRVIAAAGVVLPVAPPGLSSLSSP